jgi:hypothetical protein
MRPRLSALWLPLIAVLLASPLLGSTPLAAGDGARLQVAGGLTIPEARPAEPITRLLPTIKAGSPLDHRWSPSDGALAAALPLVFTGPAVLGPHSQPETPPRGSARGRQPFSTGPPPTV